VHCHIFLTFLPEEEVETHEITTICLTMLAFWHIALCSLIEVDLTFQRCLIGAMNSLMMEAVCTCESLVASKRLHGAISSKAVIFILGAERA
jgi:hypothetical protein